MEISNYYSKLLEGNQFNRLILHIDHEYVERNSISSINWSIMKPSFRSAGLSDCAGTQCTPVDWCPALMLLSVWLLHVTKHPWPVDGDRMWQIVCQFVISLSIVQLYLICFFLKTYQMKACAKRTRYWQCEAPGALSNSHVKSLLSNAALCTIFLIDTLFCPHTKLCCLQDFSIVTCPMPREGKNTQWPPNLSNKSMECV